MTEQRPLSRRAFFPVLTGALSFALDAQAQGSRPFPQWVESFRPRATERGVSDETYTRVMANLKPDMSVFDAINNQPEFKEKIWQYLNRRVSDWRIQTGKEKLKEHGALLARIEKDTGVSRTVLLALWGIEIRLRRSRRAEERHASGVPLARRARLGRAAPPQVLGTGADQRAAHRRARLVDAGRDARLLGRRHGSHPVDAGSLAQCRHGL